MDWLAARIMALMANLMADRKKHPEAFEVEDFLPKFWQEPDDHEDAAEEEDEGMPWQTMLSIVEAINKAMGGKPLAGDGK